MTEFIVENVPISQIRVGLRRREKLGSLRKLKSSLTQVGQIHPISLRVNGKGFELAAGERRLRSAEALGWKTIRASIGEFDDETLRQIEADENEARDDWTEWEASKEKLRQIREAEREASNEVSAQVGQKRQGRPKSGDSESARRTGLSRQEVQRTKKHVASGEKYPVLTGRDWSRSDAMKAAEALGEMPDEDRETILTLLEEPGVPQKVAKKIVHNAAAMTKPERRKTLNLYRSDSEEKQGLAKSRLSRIPPSPPARIPWLNEAIRLTEKVIADSQRVSTAELRQALKSLKAALTASKAAYKQHKKEEGF